MSMVIFSRACAVAAASIALVALWGWVQSRFHLTNWGGGVAMQPAAVIGVLSLSAAVFFRERFASPSMGIPAIILGLIALARHTTGSNIEIDTYAIRFALGMDPMAMAPSTSLCLVLFGAALFYRKTDPTAYGAVLFVTVISATAMIGHIFDVEALYRYGTRAGMSYPTSVAILFLCTARLHKAIARKDHGSSRSRAF